MVLTPISYPREVKGLLPVSQALDDWTNGRIKLGSLSPEKEGVFVSKSDEERVLDALFLTLIKMVHHHHIKSLI